MAGPTVVVRERPDTRSDGPMLGGERDVLEHWLDLYRETVFLKIAGLTGDQLARRAAPPSSLSLAGVVRHLTEVEAYWLRTVLHGDVVADRWSTKGDPDADLDGATADNAAASVEAYEQELVASRAALAQWSDLDGPVVGLRHGKQLNLRWILTHLVEEYARHLGHMDLLRESVDGRTGY
ncbi:MAG: DinB family protein [Janibacter sp.]